MTDAFLNILHVEPCIASATEVRDRLQSLGHHVEHVRDTAAALQRFEALQPQLVIVDEAVDGDGGLSRVRPLRAAPRGSWVPVLLTAAATADHAELRRAQARARVWEIPISYCGRTYAEGKKIDWRDGLAALWHIMRFNLGPRPRSGSVQQ